MTNYQILFLDIDGTILKSDHTIEKSTIDAIKQVRVKGLEVVLATGRPLHEIASIAEELDIHSFIGYNGAYAIYKNKDILNEPMNGTTIDYYLEVAENHNHEMVLYTSENNHFTSLDNPIVKTFIDTFDLKKNTLYTPKVNNDVLGITLMNLKENETSLYIIEEENVNFSQVNVPGLQHSYDVIRENVNKGRAIKHVLSMLNIPQENAIAFGDGMNDKEMLQFVGEGFAMGNGHPDLFQYAKHKTTSVDESGIFNGLKSIGLVK